MVDALQPADHYLAAFAAARGESEAAAPFAIAFEAFGAEALARYADFCGAAVHSAHQDPLWLSAWAAETGADMLAVTIGEKTRPQMMLVVEIARRGPFRVARFPGGRHANGNFPPATRAFLASKGARAAVEALPAALGAARNDIDLISLERIEPTRNGFNNPLAAITTGTSPNVALAVNLSGGFEALLSRTSGKRKLKKHRSQTRKFETAGGHRLVRATTPAAVDEMLSAFFAMKADRFRRMGIRNVFAQAEVQAFFRRLYREALAAPSPRFVLDGLEVGGRLKAVTGCSVLDGRMTCDFSAIAENGIASVSPGDFLFFEDIRRACAEGLSVFDFSVGDEPYKRLWSDIETMHSDVFLPLSGKGRAMALVQKRLAATKHAIKNNPLAWKLAKRLRRGVAGQQRPIEDDE